MEVLSFGRKNHLIGILERAENAKHAVILWNTGVSNRNGPFRINVEASSALVSLGYTVLRFDLSKLGDSQDPLEYHSSQTRNSLDLKDAIDKVAELCAIEDFVLVGLCSGAVDSFYYAIDDPRIRGIFMVDSLVYPTTRHQLSFLAMRMTSPYRWKRLFKKLLAKFRHLPAEAMPEDYFESNYPTPSVATKGFQRLVDRGVELQLIYTGGFTPYYSYRGQFFAMLPLLDGKSRIQVDCWPDVDHLFMLLEDRARFIACLGDWLKSKLPASERSLPAAKILALSAPSFPNKDLGETTAVILDVFHRILAPSRLEAGDSFFDFGGTSVLALKTVAELTERLEVDIPVVALYSYMQASTLAKAILAGEFALKAQISKASPTRAPEEEDEAFAIIGMACKVPGAENMEEFWNMILSGREGITHWTKEELDTSLPDHLARSSSYVPSRGVIEGDRFDAAFFKMSKREAQLLDPQQRILLETSWQALEDSGYLADRSEHKIAVYAGVGGNSYLTRNLAQGHFEAHSEEEYLALLLNDKDYVATRIAYAMNLKGPAIAVHTACSTSLVAVIEAIKALKAGQADIAIAGAASVNAPIASGHLYQDGGIFSRDGHCRPFDARASGTMFSDGAAVVVIKSLQKALADQDRIYSVIKGWGLNNDGSDKSSFAAPSVFGQTEAIRQAIDVAHIDPATIGYIECHGTGTPIGDPIELEGLKRAYSGLQRGSCALGSSKANIGHLTAAAGTISLIKAALAVQHAIKPGLSNFTEPHPNLRLDQSPFTISAQNQEWKGLRRAGVSSFGIGGSNAHVIIEEAPPLSSSARAKEEQDGDPWLTVRWTAADADTALRLQQRLRAGSNLLDLSYTLARRRPRLAFGGAVTSIAAIDFSSNATIKPMHRGEKPKLIFMFPGQGSQYPRMGLELSQSWPRFGRLYQKALSYFKEHFDLDLHAALQDESLLNQTQYTQAALFALEWSMAEALRGAGFEISAVLGHSLGEISAAAVAGILRFEEAAKLVFHRARLMQKSEAGLMLAIRASRVRIQGLIDDGWDLAAENSSQGLVASGSVAAIENLEAALEREDIPHKRLKTSHAFHSRMMDSILPEFAGILEGIAFEAPKIDLYSTVTGRLLTVEQATSRRYWVDQIRATVLFHQALQSVRVQTNLCFLELGPKDTLSKFARLDSTNGEILASLPRNAPSETDELGLLFSALSLLDHAPFIASSGSIVGTAPYPFRGERHWLEPKAASRALPPQRNIRNNIVEKDHPVKNSRVLQLLAALLDQKEESLGLNASWAELGMDSLLLTQWALKLQKEFDSDINLRRLQNDLPNLTLLMQFLGKDEASDFAKASKSGSMPSREEDDWALPSSDYDPRAMQRLMQEQIQLMNRQLDIMQTILGNSTRERTVGPGARPDLEPARTLARAKTYHFVDDRGSQSLEAPEGAFLGLDEQGQPGLYIEDSKNPGQFLKIEKA